MRIDAERLMGIAWPAFLAACVLTVVLFINELGISLVPAPVLKWSYPAIQPLGRLLIGVWLWRESRRT